MPTAERLFVRVPTFSRSSVLTTRERTYVVLMLAQGARNLEGLRESNVSLFTDVLRCSTQRRARRCLPDPWDRWRISSGAAAPEPSPTRTGTSGRSCARARSMVAAPALTRAPATPDRVANLKSGSAQGRPRGGPANLHAPDATDARI